VAWVFSGVFSGLAIILSAHTIWGHLRQYSAPRLQKYELLPIDQSDEIR